MMTKPVLVFLGVLMMLLVGLVKRDGRPIDVRERMRILGIDVRVTVSVEVNPDRRWWLREPGLACVAGEVTMPTEGGR